MYDHIYVVGNGKTSRANVEALIDDYIYANPKVIFHLYSAAGLSEAQIWLKQYLEDQKVEFTVRVNGDGEPTQEGSLAYFILWSDEDPESTNLLAAAKELNAPAFDLTQGLASLIASDNIQPIQSPEIPKQEQVEEVEEPELEAPQHPAYVAPTTVTSTTIPGPVNYVLEYDEDTQEDPLYAAVDYIAKTIAEAVAREIKKALDK